MLERCVESVQSSEGQSLLQEAARPSRSSNERHIYAGVHILEDARVINGNVDWNSAGRNEYGGFVAKGRAKAVNGDTSGKFASDFFK